MSRSIQNNGDKAFSTAAPGTTATLLLAANPARATAMLVNNGTATVFLGKDATVTTTTGIPLAAGASLVDDRSSDAWYGILATGTGDVRVLEVT